MFCKNCGKEIGQGNTFCPNCGTPVNGASQVTQQQKQAVKQKGSSTSVVLSIVVGIIAFIAAFFLTKFLLNGNKKVDNKTENTTQQKENTPKKEEEESPKKEEKQSPKEEQTKTVVLGNNKLEIPQSMTYEMKGSGVVLTASDWYAYVEIGTGSYQAVVAKFDDIIAKYKSLGYQTSEKKTASFTTNDKNRNFMYLDLVKDDLKYIAAYSEYNDYSFFAVEIYKYNPVTGYSYDYDKLEDISSILNSVSTVIN